MLPSADFIVPVEIESQIHNVYVMKRPGVDHFLKEMGRLYEIVVFTASLSKASLALGNLKTRLLLDSMPTLCWIIWILAMSFDIACSVKAVIITKAITSR